MKNCFVVAIFDCCREDISSLEKDFGARELDDPTCTGSFIVLYGCEPSANRGADNLMVTILEARIEQAVRESGDGAHFLMHKVFKDFWIEDRFCPDYRRMSTRLLLEYRENGQGFTFANYADPAQLVPARLVAQEPEKIQHPATNNQTAQVNSVSDCPTSVTAANEVTTNEPQQEEEKKAVVHQSK